MEEESPFKLIESVLLLPELMPCTEYVRIYLIALIVTSYMIIPSSLSIAIFILKVTGKICDGPGHIPRSL